VIVTARTANRHPLPHRHRRIDTIDNVLDRVLLGNNPPLGITTMIAVKARRDLLFERWLRQQVACQLFDRELIERHVAIQGFEDPVAPAPHEAFAVALVAIGVGVASRVEPVNRHSLCKARRGQQPIDDLLVRVR
jgi:hypothetical protein